MPLHALSYSARFHRVIIVQHIIFRWMSLKSTIEYLGEREMLYNPNFNCTEFDTIRNFFDHISIIFDHINRVADRLSHLCDFGVLPIEEKFLLL